jgi:hypothetical protein
LISISTHIYIFGAAKSAVMKDGPTMTDKELIAALLTPLANEETMKQWDRWRKLMENSSNSLPRDAFECWCDSEDDIRREAAARIEALGGDDD